jgi:hypothetical protein
MSSNGNLRVRVMMLKCSLVGRIRPEDNDNRVDRGLNVSNFLVCRKIARRLDGIGSRNARPGARKISNSGGLPTD